MEVLPGALCSDWGFSLLLVCLCTCPGNDCLFAYNNITDMCYESTDTGAFYTGYSWIRRGNIIRNNYFGHIRATEKTALGFPSVQAIYLDDQVSTVPTHASLDTWLGDQYLFGVPNARSTELNFAPQLVLIWCKLV